MLLGFLGFTIASLYPLGHLSSPEWMCMPTNSTRHPTPIMPHPPLDPGHVLALVQKQRGCRISDVFVDDRSIIYAADRARGGLYVLEYTGKRPLN